MPDERVVLITGVANHWGENVARKLITRSMMQDKQVSSSKNQKDEIRYRIIGIDYEPPTEEIEGLDFIQVDIRNPSFAELLSSEKVHTVCHLNFIHRYHRSEKAFDFNVLGTMKLIGACRDAGVKKVIMKSSTLVYGAYSYNPAFLREESELNGSKSFGYARDLVEIASFCSGYCSQDQELGLTVLRFPSILGPEVDTPMVRYLSRPLVPVLMGFDPMMQIIHQDDVIGALIHGIDKDCRGVFNVAAKGVLPLRRLIGLAGKIALPILHPFAYLATDVLSATRVPLGYKVPIGWDYLRYTWVADISRMENELNFTPSYNSVETLREFSRYLKLKRYEEKRYALTQDEHYLQEIIESRKRNEIN